jgi:predicted GNAT superfamily acetyltransferase
MDKIEKIPRGWKVLNEENIFKLVDDKGNPKSSIVYNIDKDKFGNNFLEIISVASGKEQGRGYYGILYDGLESFAKSQKISYLSGFIHPENFRSREVHKHLGFLEKEQVSYLNGMERRIRFEKFLSS